MPAVHRMVLEPGRRVLPPHHQLVVGVVDPVGAQPAQHRLLQLGAGCPDGQHHTGLLLAGGQGDDLVHLLVDPPGLIHDGQGEVQPLQPLGHGREDLERRPAGRDREGVGVLLDAGLQLRVELHHARGDPVAETGLPFVGGHHHHHHHLGALRPGQQLIQGQHGRRRRLALSPGQHPPGQSGTGPLIPGGGDQGTLPGPEAKGLADTMATGRPYVVGREPRHRQLAPSGAAQGQRGGVDVALGAGSHCIMFAQ
jgi:hypothetical protein